MMIEYNLQSIPTIDWLRDSLRKGPSLSLAKLVEQCQDLSKFVFRTDAREGLSSSELEEFSTGGKAISIVADDWLMELISTSQRTNDGAFIVEDWRAKPDSEFITIMSLPAIYFKNEVYYLIQKKDLRNIKNLRRIFSNTVPTFLAFHIDASVDLIKGMVMTEEVLRTAAAKTQMIISGAYDGESYVVGTRSLE
jgi:hypothetical protein